MRFMSPIYVSYILFSVQTRITPVQSNYCLVCLTTSLLYLKTLMWTSSLIMLLLMSMSPKPVMDLIWGWCISWLSTAVNVQRSDLRLWTSKAQNVCRYDKKWHLVLPCGHVGPLEVRLVSLYVVLLSAVCQICLLILPVSLYLLLSRKKQLSLVLQLDCCLRIKFC